MKKWKKIESLTFPVDKKEAISKLAFFQYFARIAPRLSELLGPLRDLTAQHKKFIPTEEHRRGFEEAKKHLLDEKVNCIRTPSSDPSDTLVLWTDASVNSISCLLTQCLEPLTDKFPKKKRLYIIGCFSSVIKPAWRNWPIWLLELISFYEAQIPNHLNRPPVLRDNGLARCDDVDLSQSCSKRSCSQNPRVAKVSV